MIAEYSHPGATIPGKAEVPQVVSEADMELAVERKLQHEKDGDVDPESGEYLDEIYDIVDAVVSRTDDPTLPALTFRVWILGMFWAIVLSIVNTLFTFRTNQLTVNPFIGVLLSYPAGLFMAAILPTRKFNLGPLGDFSFNPGKFNHKEHALIYVMCSTAAGPAYALYNIVGQKYQLYQENLTTIACVGFGIVTQCFGYGLAGLCRRYLVRPAAMLWPGNLSVIAMLNSLHQSDDDQSEYKMSRFKFFWMVVGIVAVYEVFPTFIAPILGAISLLCINAYAMSDSRARKIRLGLGSAQPGGGIGFLSLSFDWSIIGGQFPITTPLWALLNQYCGLYFMLYVVVPLLWVNNAFGIDFQIGSDPGDGPNGSGTFPMGFALNTPALFNQNGSVLSSRSFVNKTDLSLKEGFYNAQKPIYITTYFAMEYMASFIVFVAAIMHVALWYGKDVWHRFRSAMRDLDTTDVHARMMDVYPDVPDLWYVILLAINLVLGIVVCQFGGFGLPWWGVIVGLALAIVSIIPIGVIQAISGQQIGLNVMSEFMIGLILPGRIAAVMAFKTLSYMAMSQGLLLVSDLKLGHYLKIPPRAMFTVQLTVTILAVILNIFTAFIIYESFGRVTDDQAKAAKGKFYVIPGNPDSGKIWRLQAGPEAPVGWSANNYNVFLNAGAIWGAIGPARFFGPGSPYSATLYGFIIGFIAPIIPWGLHKAFPDGVWHLVNIPIIAVFPVQVGGFRSDLITPLIIGLFVNYFLKKYRHAWWKKYAYVMSAAFDSGTAITVTLIFFIFTVRADYQILFPVWGGNRADVEVCAPDYYLN
ncbi:hypothetical protein HDU76_003196, partial [Blyttiomyces sp. JEL0837]